MDYGLIVDVETTGLNSNKDQVIEIGFVEFCMDPQRGPTITNMYSGLEDPGFEVPKEITQITGLTTELVAGQKIDWTIVRKHWDRATIVIAHNSEFDRSFLMARPELADAPKHWACSYRHIDWRAKNFGSLKLPYLAADHGFANPFAHRALFDCATTFRLIAPHISELIETSYEPEYELKAIGSPFETKDVLKQNGYRWDADIRTWKKRISAKKLESERDFLARDVYKGVSRHTETLIAIN